MSFRRRLTVTLLLIVVVPVIAIMILFVPLSSESRTGKADARLAGALAPMVNDYSAALASARREARLVANNPQLGSAIPNGPSPNLDRQVKTLALTLGLTRLDVTSGGRPLARYSRGQPVANVELQVRGPDGPSGTLVVSNTDATEFAHRVNDATGLPFVVSAGGATIATGVAGASSLDLGGDGDRTENISLPSGDYRARIVSLPDAAGEVRAALLGPRGSTVLSGGRVLVGVILGALVLLAFVLIVPLVRDLRQQHERAEEEAITDELTGLSNHRRFRQILGKEVERAKRFDRPLSVVMLDLDDFKEINDSHGHLQGDRVLREVGRILRAESREVDEAARYGGEEFALVLPETRIDGAMEVGERIRRRLDAMRLPLDGRRGDLTIRASVGVAGSPEQPLETKTLIKAADQALYRAKHQGKNRTARAAGRRLPEPVTR